MVPSLAEKVRRDASCLSVLKITYCIGLNQYSYKIIIIVFILYISKFLLYISSPTTCSDPSGRRPKLSPHKGACSSPTPRRAAGLRRVSEPHTLTHNDEARDPIAPSATHTEYTCTCVHYIDGQKARGP
jgi:hypothetical protein